MFNRIKDFRRIATRYDRLAINFRAAVCIVATVSFWLSVPALTHLICCAASCIQSRSLARSILRPECFSFHYSRRVIESMPYDAANPLHNPKSMRPNTILLPKRTELPMPLELLLESKRVYTDSLDEEGCLVFLDGRLVAVLVRLEDESHAKMTGSWFLEAGFGPCRIASSPLFKTGELGLEWIRSRLQP